MTASAGREVDANLPRCAALGSAQARAEPEDAGGQDLGDLIEALGWGHEVGVEGVGQLDFGTRSRTAPICFLPPRGPKLLKGSPDGWPALVFARSNWRALASREG